MEENNKLIEIPTTKMRQQNMSSGQWVEYHEVSDEDFTKLRDEWGERKYVKGFPTLRGEMIPDSEEVKNAKDWIPILPESKRSFPTSRGFWYFSPSLNLIQEKGMGEYMSDSASSETYAEGGELPKRSTMNGYRAKEVIRGVDFDCMKKATYQAVVEFIKFYNQNK